MFFRGRQPEASIWRRFRVSADGFTFEREGDLYVARVVANAERVVDLFYALSEQLPPAVDVAIDDLRSGRSWKGEAVALPGRPRLGRAAQDPARAIRRRRVRRVHERRPAHGEPAPRPVHLRAHGSLAVPARGEGHRGAGARSGEELAGESSAFPGGAGSRERDRRRRPTGSDSLRHDSVGAGVRYRGRVGERHGRGGGGLARVVERARARRAAVVRRRLSDLGLDRGSIPATRSRCAGSVAPRVRAGVVPARALHAAHDRPALSFRRGDARGVRDGERVGADRAADAHVRRRRRRGERPPREPGLGALVFVAVLLHKFPEGLAISSLFLAAGARRRVGDPGGRARSDSARSPASC